MEPNTPDSEPKKHSWLWAVLAVLLAAAALGALWWWKYMNPDVAATCKPENIALSVGASQTANNNEFTRAVLTNKGNTTCSLKGHPVVSMLDEKGENRVTGDAIWNYSYPEETVTLSPRGKAHAMVGFPEATEFRPGQCGDMKTLRLYLPGSENNPFVASLTTELAQKVCPGFSVTVVRAGE